MTPIARPARRAADLLGGPDLDRVLAPALDLTGTTLRSWTRRALHRHGATGVSAVLECVIADAVERDRTVVYVAHWSSRPVPDGGIPTEVDGLQLRLWRFPRDPFLPGLADAVDREFAAAQLQRHELGADRTSVHTLRYRPSRRAVVSWGRPGAADPLAYCKVLGGRTGQLVQLRTERVVGTHRHLRSAVPVPIVVGHDPDAGRVLLSPLRGTPLRALLRTGGQLPPVDAVLTIPRQLHAAPVESFGADPRGYADVTRHVDTLAQLLPDRADEVERIAEAAAELDGPTVMVHGDLHDGQLLVEADTVVGVLDVDGAGPGLAAQDLGRLVANCEAATLFDGEGADRAAAFAEELFTGACELVDPDDLVRAAAGAWVALATGPHRAQTGRWQPETHERIDRAVAWLQRLG